MWVELRDESAQESMMLLLSEGQDVSTEVKRHRLSQTSEAKSALALGKRSQRDKD